MTSRDNSLASTKNSAASATKNSVTSGDRSTRSVFVGNISYEVNEDQLRQVFSQVGPVLHLRLVYDRESGKPKGYGFCEFHDTQTAESAIRNLNGYELKGRPLRVDSTASGERNADEALMLQAAYASQQMEQSVESSYGAACGTERAPEMISRAVASLPPEQMFELMKQMKQCVINTPNEAKNLLLNNAQLAYALLEALIVMRVVDPDTALSMLHQGAPVVSEPFHLGSSIRGPALTVSVASAVHSISEQAQVSTSLPLKAAAAPAGGQSDPEISSEDQQQAQLLMQVLQLSEDQIALLPPDDRRKVIELRNQLRSV